MGFTTSSMPDPADVQMRYAARQVIAACQHGVDPTCPVRAASESESGLYHLEGLPATGGGHYGGQWEESRSRRFPGERNGS